MIFLDLTTLVLSVSSLLYFLVAGFAFTRRHFQEWVIRSLSLYAAGAGLWSLFQLARHLGWLNFLGEAVLVRTPSYSAPLLAFLLLDLSHSFLRLEKLSWRRRGVGLAALLALILLDSLPFSQTLIAGPGWAIPRQAVTLSALVLAWGIYIGLATFGILKMYRTRQQPLHRNRMTYWSTVLGLMVLGVALTFGRQEIWGSSLQLLATLIAAYAVLTHSLLDVPHMTRRLLSYLFITLLTALIFVAGFSAAEFVLQATPSTYNPWLIRGSLALLAALLFNPISSLIRRLIYGLISGSGYDSNRLLGDYSHSISNILELERLAALVIDLIDDAMGVQRGLLFLVDQKEENGRIAFHLYSLPRPDMPALPPGKLLDESPIAGYLRLERTPLTQYDLDLLPRFQKTPPEEHAWFSSLNLDVYVPIYAKQKWIGLLALGPKLSGDRYDAADLHLLNTLANQTAVALENARLVTDLVKLNDDLRRAYTALDQANRQLEHLDRAKSQFITIISHELRTPLTILLGYGQLLVDDSHIAGHHRQLAEGIYNGSQRMNEIIESMLEVTKIDSRLLKVNPAPVALSMLIDQTCTELESLIAERTLKIEKQASLRSLPRIEADPNALSKVFYHLILNAIKYTPDGGQITISGRSLSNAPGDLNLKGAYLELVVSDTGIGIDPNYHDLIFTKFYQTGEVALHSTGKTKFKGGGPGLGLAIVRGIVEVHGGKVWVESPGHNEQACPGSHFHVILPLRQRVEKT